MLCRIERVLEAAVVASKRTVPTNVSARGAMMTTSVVRTDWYRRAPIGQRKWDRKRRGRLGRTIQLRWEAAIPRNILTGRSRQHTRFLTDQSSREASSCAAANFHAAAARHHRICRLWRQLQQIAQLRCRISGIVYPPAAWQAKEAPC